MTTLLQTLLIETLPEETDPILRSFIETILPAMEREFALIPALGGSEEAHYQTLVKQGDRYAREKAQRWASKADQSLLVHVLNALLTAWNLSEYLPHHLQLSEVEKRLLCLGLTLHDYNKYVQGQGEEFPPPRAHEVVAILELCQNLGEKLNFQAFWDDWQQYLLEIAFLAQNTQFNVGSNAVISNWEIDGREFTLDDRRLNDFLRHLLAFGDVAVHMNDPADVVTKTGGDRLRDHLDWLEIRKTLVYHRLRDCRGLLTNQIHNAVVSFASEIGWEPILYFAQGAVYLAPQNNDTPDLAELKLFVWEKISSLLGSKILSGDIGFKKSKEGLKVADETRSLLLDIFTPSELIPQFPDIVATLVKSAKTPERLEKLVEKSRLSDAEKQILNQYADKRADRMAEFLTLTLDQFFKRSKEQYISWILSALELQKKVSPEQAAFEAGGVRYGWYYTAACYVAANATMNDEDLLTRLSKLADELVAWAEENNLLPKQSSKSREAFFDYIDKYVELNECESHYPSFENELARYSNAKLHNKPICSLSSGEFIAENQSETVVLFQPQLYSNKNKLGGTQLRRGISTIWFLEMLLRKAIWTVPTGKTFENKQPIFLYLFPAYVYSPQSAAAVRRLVKKIKNVSLADIRQHWIDAGMHYEGLQNLSWLLDDEPEPGQFGDKEDKYSRPDLPFMATIPLTPEGKKPTVTDAWVKPAFFALTLPMLLGIKVVTTSSPEPLYASDSDFHESVILDAPAGFWNLLSLPTSLRLQELPDALNRLLVAYSLHLDVYWKDLNNIVQAITTNPLNIFSIGEQRLRREKGNKQGKGIPTSNDVKNYWKYAQILVSVDKKEDKSMSLIEQLVNEYRKFYRVSSGESSHAILLPLSIALENILSIPNQVDLKDVILEGAGQIQKALDRREIYRPILMDKSTGLDSTTRLTQELAAIQTFMSTCVDKLFVELYKSDRALLQENRNRIKSGAEFAYRWLALQEKQAQASKPESDNPQTEGEVA